MPNENLPGRQNLADLLICRSSGAWVLLFVDYFATVLSPLRGCLLRYFYNLTPSGVSPPSDSDGTPAVLRLRAVIHIYPLRGIYF